MYKLVTTVAILICCWYVPGSFGANDKPCSPTVTKTIDWVDKGVETCLNKILAHVKVEFDAALTYTALSAHFQQENHFRPAVAKFFLDSAAEERGHAKKLLDYARMRGGQFENPADSGTQTIPEKPKTTGTPTTTATPPTTGTPPPTGDNPGYDLNIKAWNFEKYKKLTIKDGTAWLGTVKASEGKVQDKLGCGKTLTVMCALNVALDLETDVTNKIRNLVSTCEKSPSEYNDYHSVDYLTGEFLTEQHEGTRQLAGMIANLQQISYNMGDYPGLAEIVFDQSLA